jgi:hypothetical protein
VRYCGVWNQKNVRVEIDEDDQDVITTIHEECAGETDRLIAEICMRYLRSDERLLSYAKRHGGVH